MPHSSKSESWPEHARYDVIIVGSGAGGSTIAHRLSGSGKSILVLERGQRLPREPENWDTHEVFATGRYKTKETWLDQRGHSFQPQTHFGVGGNTKVYGSALFRLREGDFDEAKVNGRLSPAWPIGYQDLAPYYLQAEQLYQVHGVRGSDPTEPPCNDSYSFPALSHDPVIQALFDRLGGAGYRPFPLPLGLLRDESSPPTSNCVRCAKCDGYPCPVRGKADAEVICLNPALEQTNVSLVTGATVERLLTDASGRNVSAVVATIQGKTISLTADIVILACGAINSAALLLRSADEKHPHGVANSSDVVGRNYMCHHNSALLAFSRAENTTAFQKTFGLNDFYQASATEGPLGHVQLLGKTDAGQLAAQSPVPLPGSVLAPMARHSIDFWLISEDFPEAQNRVTVERDGQVRLSYIGNNHKSHRRLRKRFKTALTRSRASRGLLSRNIYMAQDIPISGVSHQCGTVRFGADARTSALDINCRAHDVDNLYVVDSSFFPSSGAINPTLTIYANALRVGDIIKERLK